MLSRKETNDFGLIQKNFMRNKSEKERDKILQNVKSLVGTVKNS